MAPIVATVLAAGTLSSTNFEFVIGQGAYAVYAGLALVMFALAVQSEGEFNFVKTRAVLTLTLAGAAAIIVTVSNPARGVLTVIVPLVIGWLFGAAFSTSEDWRKRLSYLKNPVIFFIVIGAVIGSIFYESALIPNLFSAKGVSKFNMASIDEMRRHVIMLPHAWFDYFGLAPTGQPMAGWGRLAQLCVWLMSLGLILVPIYIILRRRHYPRAIVLYSWIAISCYGVAVGALVVTKDMFIDFSELRYATSGFYASLCVISYILAEFCESGLSVPKAVVIFACSISVIPILNWRPVVQPDGITYQQRIELIREMKKNHVGTFVSTYWNSYVTTVLSGGDISGYPITATYPMGIEQLSMNSPTRPVYGHDGGREALVLTHDEQQAGVLDAIYEQIGAPLKSVESGPFSIMIYNKDILALVYGQGIQVNSPVPEKKLMVYLSQMNFPRCGSGPSCVRYITATNAGAHTLTSAGTRPLRLGVQGIDAGGNVVEPDLGRAVFALPLEAGQSERIGVRFIKPSRADVSGYRICLLQEHVAWHCDRTGLSVK